MSQRSARRVRETAILGPRDQLWTFEFEAIAGAAGVFVYQLHERGLRGRLLHNERQVSEFISRWPTLGTMVRETWSVALELRAHREMLPARVSSRPDLSS